MPTVELYESQPLKLTSALLIYEEANSYKDKNSAVVVTRHPIVDGQIQPGEPLDLRSFRKLLDGDADTAANATAGWEWRFPRMVAESAQRIAWWSPPRIHDIYVGNDGAKRTRTLKAWVPALLWVASRTTPICRLYAYDGEQAPNQGTDVYHPRFGPDDGANHIHADCSICVGSMILADYSPDSWERGFWSSRFKVPGRNLQSTTPYAPSKVFKKVGTAESVLTHS